MIVELILLSVTTLLLYIYWKQTYSEYAVKLNKFAGNKAIPVFGNILEMQGTTEDIFNYFRKCASKFGESYRGWAVHNGNLNVIKAEDVEIILSSNKHIDKSLIYEFMNPWLGTGLLTSTGAKWQHRRKLLTPAFHFNILRRFVETFGEQSMKLVEDLRKECSKQKTNIHPYIANSTLQVICETAMGTTLDPKDKVQKKYLQAIYEMGKIVMKRIVSPWMYNHTIFNMLPIGWKNRKNVNILHSFTSSVIKEREANFKDSDVMNLDKKPDDIEDDADGVYKKKKLAMLDLLLSAKKNNNSIDDEGLREEVDTFMFEGHDTTSSAISLALVLLANHKDVQEKIFLELDEIFGNSKRPANYDDLQKLPYLDICIKECMRIFPPVPIISRLIHEDLQLSKYVAPAGAIINIHILDLHRDPTVFPDPLKFDPDRFLPENCKGRHPFAYVPFSAGPRNCIGQKFAMLEIKSVISAILRNYELEAVDKPADMRFIVDFVLRTTGEINIKFKERNNQSH